MMNFTALRNSTEFEKAVRQFFAALLIWLLAMIVFIAAISLGSSNRSKLDEAQKVLAAATRVKAYGQRANAAVATGSALTSLSEIINLAGISDRVARLDSNGSDTLLQADRLYPDEIGKLINEIAAAGMQVNSAEIKAVQVKGERLLSVVFSIGGADK